MRYAEHRPPPDLTTRVECIWIAEDPEARPEPERVLPDGCVEWIFHLGAPYAHAAEGARPEPQAAAFLVGPSARPLRIAPTGPVRTLGVRFRPGGARDAAGVALDELAEQTVAAADLWGAEGRSIADQVAAAPTDTARRDAIERFLRRRIRDARPRAAAPRLDAAVRAVLAGGGRRPVETLARGAGWSPRQLEREFRAAVGLSPKVFSRIIRFQALLLRAARSKDAAWADLAAASGYADQAHLAREFRAFSGATPTSGESACGELGRYFVAPERLAALLTGGRAPMSDVAFVQDLNGRPA